MNGRADLGDQLHVTLPLLLACGRIYLVEILVFRDAVELYVFCVQEKAPVHVDGEAAEADFPCDCVELAVILIEQGSRRGVEIGLIQAVPRVEVIQGEDEVVILCGGRFLLCCRRRALRERGCISLCGISDIFV